MEALLIAVLVAPPMPARPSEAEVARRLTGQWVEAMRLMVKAPDQAVGRLDALLNDPEARELEAGSLTIRTLREQARYIRARLRINQGQAQAVADEMSEVLQRRQAHLVARVAGLTGALAGPGPLCAAFSLPPGMPLDRSDWLQPLNLRAQAWIPLGQADRGKADGAAAQEILTEIRGGLPARHDEYEDDEPPLTGIDWSEWVQVGARWLGWLFTRRLFLPGLFAAVAVLFFLQGLRQRRDAGGSWLRLAAVSLALAAVQTAPAVVAALLLWSRPSVERGGAILGVAIGVFLTNFFWLRNYLTAVTWDNTREAPPLLDDPAAVARVRELSARLGVAPPVTRVVRSPSSQQMNEAMVAGLAAPTMLLFDGILYRLSEEERDAIIAHELAHLANHSFWYWLAAGGVSSVATVVAATFVEPFVAITLGPCLMMGLTLILSRRLELDCDRRAAAVMGHRQAASALRKIHTDQPFQGQPIVEFLIGAVSTHPSLDERLAAVYRAAPPDDRPDVEWDARLLSRRRLAAWAAALLWAAALAFSLWWSYRWPRWWVVSGVLQIAVTLTPVTLLLLGLRKHFRRQGRLQKRPWRWLAWLSWVPPAVVCAYVAVDYAGLTRPYISRETNVLILLSGMAVMFAPALFGRWLGRVARLEQQTVIAVQSGDYARALRLCEDNPEVVAKSSALRHNRSIALAVLGRRDEAMAESERLMRDDPEFKMSAMLLASVYGDEGRFAEALALVEGLKRDLPGEAAGPLAEAWFLRKLGRLDEAEARVQEGRAVEPQHADIPLMVAAIALDRGDFAAAREQMALAERLNPGSMAGALVAAELALAADDPAAAAVIEKARAAARNNPLAFAEKEVAALAERLEARRGGIMIDRPFGVRCDGDSG